MLAGIFSNFKTITPEKYNDVTAKLELHYIHCNCGHAGCLVRHGYYSRKLKTSRGTYIFKILRVKCKECGRTHAILPELIVPYSQLPVDSQHEMLLHSLGSEALEYLLSQNPDITESDVLRVRARFRKYWRERLAAAFTDLNAALTVLLDRCYKCFFRQFMQVRHGIYLRFCPIHIA